MKRLIAFGFFLLISLSGSAQEQPDSARLFLSLESALKNPGQVYRLRLSKQKLNEFPTEILLFKNLRELDLSKNKIKELPDSIGTLKHLRKLDVSRNKLTTLPQRIGQLSELKALIANQNQLDSLPAEIGQLENLEYLDLWSNNLATFPAEMSKMKSLKEIDLRNIQYNFIEQDRIRQQFPNVKLHLSPACNCGN